MQTARTIGMLVSIALVAACGGKGSGGNDQCGDGLVGSSEACDDGNLAGGDGCDDRCEVEEGWSCDDEPSDCGPVCGDDQLVGAELCDGAELGGQDCASLGLGGGTLSCGADCTFDVTGCDIVADCGNGAREYPEDCDATDLAGQQCTDLGFTGGDLACASDCTFDTAGCDGPDTCGDGVLDPGEACDGAELDGETCQSQGFDGGDLACTGNCTFDTSSCTGTGPVCGDNTAEGSEACDGSDLAGASCETLGFDYGTLGCSGTCDFDLSGCDDCPAGLTYCNGSCVDVLNDPTYCGDCLTSCTAPQICVGGQCSQPDLDWVDVGTQPIGPARAHDLAVDGTAPTVARTTTGNAIAVEQYDGAAWVAVGDDPAQPFSNLNDALDLEYHGGAAYLLFSASTTMSVDNVHLVTLQGAAWAATYPAWQSACMAHEQVAMAFDATGPHIVTYGAGGCGIGADYAWYDGAAWQSHPSTTGFAAQLTMNGNGYPDLVVTDRAYVGLPEQVGFTMDSEHHLRYWDGMAWASLQGPLDEDPANGWQEHMSLVADPAGNIYAAWAENTGINVQRIFVKRWDVLTQSWTLLGQPEPAGGVGEPHITLIGSVPWITYTSSAGVGTGVVIVKRYDPVNLTWEQVGSIVNAGAPPPPGIAPVLVGIDGIPYVAFRQDDLRILTDTLWVKHYVPTP